ncbi:MAG: Uma2 family endonuclease [Leptolyngbyaceae cyanobacterium SM1_1_3]|nr:Uma2 family endonuclease [Leptolyngbyaceae cyanobacterium SM1_1_3]NJN01080.1 Uma2 family endonuclease [Leptolyngbyaceae cyanobacterium RM1_1_2]NJO11486.1 Uma2 family endonuclease [Leptolyngbyaceae cyanobacterium SL_1_1]
MTQAKAKFTTFEDYLTYSDETPLEGRYELIEGALVKLPPESEPNNWIANHLQFLLVMANVVPLRLIRIHALELQVPVLRPKDAANRYPDLVVLRPEHLNLMKRRLTLTLDMPPPRLIVEVVSPGKSNHDRDYIHKRAQYAAIAVAEYWLVDPVGQTVAVLALSGDSYEEIGVFSQQMAIASAELAGLELTPEQIFALDS